MMHVDISYTTNTFLKVKLNVDEWNAHEIVILMNSSWFL